MADKTSVPVWTMTRLMHLAGVYALATVAGAVAAWIAMPLPWMLGPFFVLAALSASGFRFPLIPMGRELAQVAIGLAIGLRFTPPVLAATVLLLPEMIGATLYLMGVTLIAAFVFRPLSGVDKVTSFFATAAGGVADMAMVAERFGGTPSSVAVVHAMRVSLVVALVPFIVFYLGEHGSSQATAPATEGQVIWLGLGLVSAYVMAVLLKPAPLPNRWLVGPILAGMVFGLTDLVSIVVPGWMITVAQILLGTWLGCQFRRDLLAALPRVTASAAVVAGFLVICAALGAVVLADVGDMPFSTAFLALAPAAVTEMVLVAKLMALDAETVAAFHVMRIVIISSTILVVFRFYTLLNGGRLGS